MSNYTVHISCGNGYSYQSRELFFNSLKRANKNGKVFTGQLTEEYSCRESVFYRITNIYKWGGDQKWKIIIYSSDYIPPIASEILKTECNSEEIIIENGKYLPPPATVSLVLWLARNEVYADTYDKIIELLLRRGKIILALYFYMAVVEENFSVDLKTLDIINGPLSYMNEFGISSAIIKSFVDEYSEKIRENMEQGIFSSFALSGVALSESNNKNLKNIFLGFLELKEQSKKELRKKYEEEIKKKRKAIDFFRKGDFITGIPESRNRYNITNDDVLMIVKNVRRDSIKVKVMSQGMYDPGPFWVKAKYFKKLTNSDIFKKFGYNTTSLNTIRKEEIK